MDPPLPVAAVLLSNVDPIIYPSVAPSWKSTAPPLVSARLFLNIPLLIVTFVQFSNSPPCRYIAPPRFAAWLFINVQLSIRPSDPVQMTAPPSPPVVL